MKKWSAHMLTGARNMTSRMRATGTCRPEEGGPACRRGAARGAKFVARFAVVAVMACVFGLTGLVASAEAAVSALTEWTYLEDAASIGNGTLYTSTATFTVPPGAGDGTRLLVISVGTETSGNSTETSTVVQYGGVTLTKAANTSDTDNGVRQHTWVGYLFDTDIPAGANAVSVTSSNSSNQDPDIMITYAVYEGVLQTASPVNDLVTEYNEDGTVELSAVAGTLAYVNEGMTIFTLSSGRTPFDTTSFAAPFDQGTLLTTAANVSMDMANSRTVAHTADGSYAHTTTTPFTFTAAGYRTASAAISLLPAPSNPTVTINQASGQADPTNATPIVFDVVFSLPVADFATGDVNLSSSTVGGTLVGTVAEVAPNDGTTYTVSVTGMTSDGDVVASIDAGVASNSGNGNLASTSSDDTVTYDTTAPTVDTATIASNNASPTWAKVGDTITVSFTTSETPDTTPTVTIAGNSATVSGSGTSWSASYDMTGTDSEGTVAFDISIDDAAGNTGTRNTITSGSNVTFDRTAPTVAISNLPDPSSGDPITGITVTFSEVVTGFAGTDISVTSLGTGTASVTSFTNVSGDVYTFSLASMSEDDTYYIDIAADAAIDAAGNGNTVLTPTASTVWTSCVDLTPSSFDIPADQTVSGSVDLTSLYTANGNVTPGTITYNVAGNLETSPWDSTAYGTGSPEDVIFIVGGNDPDCPVGIGTEIYNSATLTVDNRPDDITVGVAYGNATSTTSILVTMPYGGDKNGTAAFQVDYKKDSVGTWTIGTATADGDGLSPYQETLSGLDPDSTYDIRVTYTETKGGDSVIGTAVQTFQVTLVSWVDNDMLHNSLRFACSQLAADGSTITTEAACNAAGGLWSPDRRHTGGWGTSSSTRYGAILCSTCHEKGTTNIKRITKQVTLTGNPTDIPGAAETNVTYTFADGTNSDLGDSNGAHATSNKICEVCHTYSATDPNSPTYNSAPVTNGVRYHGYKMDTATVENQSHYIDSDCISCHEHNIGFRASCNACHDSPPLDADGLVSTDLTGSATWGKHDEHVNGQGYADCNTCHTGWDAGGEMPKNGEINIGFSLLPATPTSANSVYDGRSAGQGYNPDTGNTWVTQTDSLTCANYCHGSTIGGDSSKAKWLDTWDNPTETEFQCGDCHGDGTNTNVNTLPSGTSHNTHVNVKGLGCTDCHGSDAGATGHVGASVSYNVGALPLDYRASGSVLYNGAKASVRAGVAPNTGNYKQCSNVDCHWGVDTPAWNNTIACGDCHAALPTSGSHGDHVEANPRYVTCDSCHGAGATTGTHTGHIDGNATYNTSVLTTGLFTGDDGRGADNENCAVICHNAAVWGGDITWTTASSTASCSSNTNFTDGQNMTNYCLDCHSDTYSEKAGPQIISGVFTGTHLDPKINWSPTCAEDRMNICLECHVEHTGAKSTAAVWSDNPPTQELRDALALDYNGVRHYNAVNLRKQIPSDPTYTAGSQVTGNSEAEICWGCHDSNRDGASRQSEWGVNNNPETGGIGYDYGSVGTNVSSWFSGVNGANWQSGKHTYFSYKEAAIQSTHSANFTSGTAAVTSGNSLGFNRTETIDAVADIRCHYCHDVHGTHDGINGDVADSGDGPYLRGSWKGNPYPEDGAPRSTWTAWSTETTASTASPSGYGSVPRGSASTSNTGVSGQPNIGGYWIDQNYGNPNNGETATGTSGLCDLCHGGSNTKNGTWTSTELGNIDYTTSEGLWVSGYNGHANVVLDGPGRGVNDSAESYARNIFTRARRHDGSRVIDGSTGDNERVDMGLAYFDRAAESRGYSFRSVNNGGMQLTPLIGSSGGTGSGDEEAYTYFHFAWSTTFNNGASATHRYSTGTVDLDVGGMTGIDTNGHTEALNYDAQANYHTFNCGKCHNPHASRLPKLMITNCLDTNHNTWDDDYGNYVSAGSTWTNTNAAQWPSAQNCHRLDSRASFATGESTARGTGWNKVTPWLETTNPDQ